LKKRYKFSREILPDVFKITLPLPGRKPGPVNVYLFKDREVTLIDTGTLQSATVLEKALAEHHLGFSDIKRIIITHGHPEHYGAANKIAKAGRAKVIAHWEDRKSIENGMGVSSTRYRNYLLLTGIPIYVSVMLKILLVLFKHMAENCRVAMTVQEGDRIPLGRYEATIIETPGHTKGSICLFLEKEKMLFCGDTMIEHITPNAFVMLEEGEKLPLRSSQKEFYQSLEKIKGLSPSVVFSAHGKDIRDVSGLIEGYQSAFAQRKEDVLSIVRSGEKNVYRTARKLFPDIGGVRLPLEIFLSISETYTTMQVLQEEGKIKMHIKKGRLEVTC
jgi:glyoxylase-like metal-dependent hydrolase (beta-lactamase superfamily II)